jgi:quinol-cytochrome oxidoreductase complex cytochrome b subunit
MFVMLASDRRKAGLISIIKDAFTYPVPYTLNSYWCFGFLAGFFLIIQIISGLLLSFYYIPDANLAFDSVRTIMREVSNGWLLRYIHVNGASFFFIAVYLHMLKNMFYGSYTSPRKGLWISGFIIYVLLIITAFLGYVLPWGQMSYWGATVISGLLSTIPSVGDSLLILLWGGDSISTITLHRFYTLHFILPCAILGLVVVHIMMLHEKGSNNEFGAAAQDMIILHPYYTIKDFTIIIIFLYTFSTIVFFAPTLLCNPVNVVQASVNYTPRMMVPEWYFLPMYSILRSVDSRGGGVILLIAFMISLYMFPQVSDPLIRNGGLRNQYDILLSILVCDLITLGLAGSKPLTGFWLTITRISTLIFFVLVLIMIPLLDLLHKICIEMNDPVLEGLIAVTRYSERDPLDPLVMSLKDDFIDFKWLPVRR